MKAGSSMKIPLRRGALALSIAAFLTSAPLVVVAQRGPGPRVDASQEDTRLPNGKLQRDEILKIEHDQNLKDAAQLVELSEQLKEELEKNDRYVVSMATVKKTDDIEKLVRKIR